MGSVLNKMAVDASVYTAVIVNDVSHHTSILFLTTVGDIL